MDNKKNKEIAFISELDSSIAKSSTDMPEKMRSMFTELTFIGALFVNPNFAGTYQNSINPDFDFTADSTRFFYNALIDIGKKTNWKITEDTINSYMADSKTRANLYQRYGGYKWVGYTIRMAESNNAIESIDSFYSQLKKYTITRAFWLKGFREFAEHIVTLQSFQTMQAKDVKDNAVKYINSVYINVAKDDKFNDITKDCTTYIQDKLEKPQMGIPFAFPFMTQLFQGIRKGQFMAWGMLSNAGKTRFLIREIANLSFVQDKKVCIISNEMSTEEVKACMITSVINNKDIQDKYNIYISKKENEIQNGLYKVDKEFVNTEGITENGFAERLKDDKGFFIESLEDFKKRLYDTSSEYRDVLSITNWIDTEMKERICVIETGIDYTDNDLKQLIDNTIFSKDIQYFFYDTFKSDVSDIGEWSAMKKTATILSTIAKKKNIFIGATIQLTDDANSIAPLNLTSSNIANSKQIKHVLDSLCLFKEIPKKDFLNYAYVDNLKENKESYFLLDENKRYYACVIDKNRAGKKSNLLLEVNLDFNIWNEVGVPIRKNNLK